MIGSTTPDPAQFWSNYYQSISLVIVSSVLKSLHLLVLPKLTAKSQWLLVASLNS